ncbi:Psi-producing oxygenase A AltName: Full=Fatty acid oxygenase ppoA; Includes: RecName: Full=Linoleate 8R-lipoxygenase; Includes: RecName: Full=9,12-octadecadienoate 8-hydroperoxide 8R-isomerase [Serendipita indica DSM 11827]|nr:Psi-producing oxygenase A AltName: Full=Fatty acid oxygenase ppoA; Includes: RecName: Full=Linoleate 8R-lipoxygenase; Includes: RecName: Full=9,12-octadecadienoate 8-hydroperoxide 8R-isomerase [Serendipita indica DSM 11827]
MSTFVNSLLSAGQLADVVNRSYRGLPISQDGLSDEQAAPATENKREQEAWLLHAAKGLDAQIRRGLPLSPSAIPSFIDAFLHAQTSTGIDDRKLLLENVLAFMSRLPPGPIQSKVQDAVIQLFWDALPHPPNSFLPSMQVEPENVTEINGVRIGPGGYANVSRRRIGRTQVPPNSKPGASASTTLPVPAAPAPVQQLPTPAPSGFVNGPAKPANGSTAPVDPTQTISLSPENRIPTKAYSSQFRTPSGAQNNLILPLLGAAGSPYARSVVPQHPVPHTILPDPGLVFDLLMRRRDPPSAAVKPAPGKPSRDYDPRVEAQFRSQGHGQRHPSGLSTMLFAFGDLIIHSLFRTSSDDPNVNLTSSYLDLSVLYGVDEAEMQTVRRYDGTGRIWEDCWADPRLFGMPPAVLAVLIVFSRNHNYVALRLLEINEARQYTSPSISPPKSNHVGADQIFPTLSGDPDKLRAQDDDIFNRARLINCAFFMNVILGDYLSGILGTFREASEWCLNPLEEIRKGGKTACPRAEGNCVSVEFNLLYRWHATMSHKDVDWLEMLVKKALPGEARIQSAPPGQLELSEDDYKAVAGMFAKFQAGAVRDRVFGGLKRTPEGGFADSDLARILHEATDTVACAYGARGIPSVMKAIEVMGIKQGRKWGVCSLNEFRKFVGLKQYESFEEWNPTGDIAKVARNLYQHIDNLELYVGLMCEESKNPGPGAGLCPGYTISRAILADAVCLTRGDRFLTTDLTPFNLTSWGFQDCARDTKNGSLGGMFSKLLFRTLPDHYPASSIYAHFPFFTPPEMKHWLTEMKLIQNYNVDRPSSDPVRPTQSINSAQGIDRVLKDMSTFNTVYGDSIRYLSNGYGFFLAFDEEPKHRDARRLMHAALYRDGAMKKYAEFYQREATRLIRLRSFETGPKSRGVNIVRDVINIVPVHWVSEELAGLPLKSEEAPRGLFTEQEMYGMFACVFTFIFLNIEPSNDWPLRQNSLKFSEIITGFVKARLQKIAGEGSLGLKDTVLQFFTDKVDNSDEFYRTILNGNNGKYTIDQLASNVFAMIVASVANFAQATTHVVDFYLDKEREEEFKHLKDLSMDKTAEADALLAGYAREGLRFRPQAPGIFRRATKDVTVVEGNGLKPVDIKAGDRIFVSLTHAGMDPSVFPDPTKVDPRRPREAYYAFGRGEHTCLGAMFTETMIPAVLRAVFSLPNVRRGPGYSGTLNTFKHDLFGTESHLYISNKGTVSPWPAFMMIEYDV